LIGQGYEVTGIDCFSDYYSPEIKRSNLAVALESRRFRLVEGDIRDMDGFPEADYVFHLAAQPGVRASWGACFNTYLQNNVEATQRLLEFYKDKDLKKFVFGSSSSVYGNARLPTNENCPVKPLSPYGVTKLAAENLCYLYWKAYRLPVVSLRYFTVFGPRQRPDMFIYKLIKASLNGQKVIVYGDGNQTRDFTYVGDVVDANLRAARSKVAGETFNIGTGCRIKINDLIELVGTTTGNRQEVEKCPAQKGDVESTCADISRARGILGWRPATRLEDGLRQEIEWFKHFS
jgi:UDP-glucose 4-epimerase